MPGHIGQVPKLHRNKFGTNFCAGIIARARGLRRAPVSFGIYLAIYSPANAQQSQLNEQAVNTSAENLPTFVSDFLGAGMSTADVILLAVFGGAVSFAMMASSWLIRERNRAVDENRDLKQKYTNSKARNERYEALVKVNDQRVVLWNGVDEKPTVYGSLTRSCGAPEARREFLDFSKWLKTESAVTFEKSLQRLRNSAEAFDLSLQANSGKIIEVQGRTSGGFAFVRFIELSGERAALANLEIEHTQLLTTFQTLQDLFDRLEMPVWLSTKNGKLFWANKSYAHAVEARDGIAAVDNDLRLFDRAQRKLIERAQEDEGHFSGTIPAIIAGDRKILQVVEVVSQTGLAAIGVDKSDVETVRATLKLTIKSHADTLDQLTTAVAIFNAEKNLEFFNSSFQNLWGLDRAFLESQPSNAAVFDALRESGRLPSQPDWRKWRDGQLEIYQALEARAENWYLPEGMTLRVVSNPQSPAGAAWIFEDVTEELELKTSYNSLIRVQGETLDHLSEAVAVFGSDGRLRLVNPALGKILQLDEEQVETGRHVSELGAGLEHKMLTDDIWLDIVGSVTSCQDERANRSGRLEMYDGKIIEFGLMPLPDGQTMLTLVDVTANVKFERALTERNDALEEAGLLKNRFLQHVSYELRTPLTTISGFGELLSMQQSGKLNSKQTEYLGNINDSAITLKAIIDDILDLATVDAGVMELELREIDAQTVLSNVVHNLEKTAENAHVSIEIDVDQSATNLIADEVRLRQIIYNLLSNAINHSPSGGEVIIEAYGLDEQIMIAVSDQGPGISESDREMIFGRFEGGLHGNVPKGAGLGLSIVESFMKLHNGSVSVEAATKRGAKFICSFPRHPVEAAQAAQ